jgi:hypothetical protein
LIATYVVVAANVRLDVWVPVLGTRKHSDHGWDARKHRNAHTHHSVSEELIHHKHRHAAQRGCQHGSPTKNHQHVAYVHFRCAFAEMRKREVEIPAGGQYESVLN